MSTDTLVELSKLIADLRDVASFMDEGAHVNTPVLLRKAADALSQLSDARWLGMEEAARICDQIAKDRHRLGDIRLFGSSHDHLMARAVEEVATAIRDAAKEAGA